MQCLHGVVLNLAQYLASNLTHHLRAWRLFVQKYGNTKQSVQILDWVEHGMKLEFVFPFSPGQVPPDLRDKHPRNDKKMQLVEELLCKTVGAKLVHAMLHRDSPAPVQVAWFQGMYTIGSRGLQSMHTNKHVYVLTAYLVRL